MAAPTSKAIQLAKALPEPLQRFFARWPPAAIAPEGAAPTSYQELRPNPFTFYKHPATGKWQGPVYSQRRQAQLVQLARDHGVEHLLPETSKGTEHRIAQRVEHGLRVKGTGVGQSVKGHIYERHLISKQVPLPPPPSPEDVPRLHMGTVFANNAARMEKRRKAMLGMPQLIREWKRVGKHNWSKWPK